MKERERERERERKRAGTDPTDNTKKRDLALWRELCTYLLGEQL